MTGALLRFLLAALSWLLYAQGNSVWFLVAAIAFLVSGLASLAADGGKR